MLWAYEIHKDFLYGFKIKNILYNKSSQYQKITVVETENFGKVLFIDEVVMFTEKYEFIYHEMITHPALHIHNSPEKVLIIGGGDGGVLREVLKHKKVKNIHLAEIDEEVIKVCKKFFPGISKSFNNKKVKVFIKEGRKFLEEASDKYDIIIIDSTDPVGPASSLFSTKFFKLLRKRLKSDGIFIAQVESPIYMSEIFYNFFKKNKGLFKILLPYLVFLPDYPFGMWGFAWASDYYSPFNFKKIKPVKGLKYYSEDIHRSAFVIPPFIMEKLRNELS